MFEVINYYQSGIDDSDILNRLNLKKHKFFVVSAHREENVDCASQLIKLTTSLNTVAEEYDLPVIVSTHPRTRNRIEANGVNFHKNVVLLKPLGFHDYNCLQKNAKTVLSDSGTINEESSIMNFPALNIREAHERPEGMEEAAVMMVGLDSARIMQALQILETQTSGDERVLNLVGYYSMSNVSDKIIRIIHSYVDYVNTSVWKKV